MRPTVPIEQGTITIASNRAEPLTNGTFMPLYFHMPTIGANVWFHPMIVYLTAIVLKLLPFSEVSVRLPSVIVGTIDIALIYLVGLLSAPFLPETRGKPLPA